MVVGIGWIEVKCFVAHVVEGLKRKLEISKCVS